MIRLIKPYIAFEDVSEDFKRIFDSGILTGGEYSKKLPEAICGYTGAPYAFNTTSATTALAVCLEILGIVPGDEVVVSDFSFPATANVVEACGGTTVFADVSLGTWNMLPEKLEEKLTKKTKAVIFVCALGNPDGIEAIAEICKNRDVPLIVDAACAIGSSSHGVKIGNIGDMSCFSFHPRKLLTSGEGGSVTTDSAEYADMLRVKLAHGAVPIDGQMVFSTYGYNYRLPEMQCAMVIRQLASLDEIVRRRVEIWKTYKEDLEALGFSAQHHGALVSHNMQSIVFAVPDGVSRDDLIASLRAKGIESTIGTYCLSACAYYQNKYHDTQPNAFHLERATITLPCYDGLDARHVTKAIKAAL
jgi:dTDP-4-amino-4,6-dideoxygalactose transaminase